MNTIIMILVLTTGSGTTAITQEFNTLAQCQYVLKETRNQATKSNKWYRAQIVSSGCYNK